MSEYLEFIASKRVSVAVAGFDAGPMVAPMFPFQVQNVTWACRMGRAALFLDTGLGKTRQQLEWARQVCEHTGGRVIILAPLAVAHQTVREAAACGITGVGYAKDGTSDHAIVVTNYERLAKFDTSQFVGVVLDESSILKSYSGTTKMALFEAFSGTPYKLACTATPAPNDHLELGNHAEFLGVMSSHEMIARWFINDTSQFGTYRVKGHAVEDFWDWVSSWAVMASLPSDLGEFDDGGYVLPEMVSHVHCVEVDRDVSFGDVKGQLTIVTTVEMNATSIHKEKRRTAVARAEKVVGLVRADPDEPWLVWCETDYEADALMAEFKVRNVAATEVRGSDTPESKERDLEWFTDGAIRVMVTKPKIAGFGLNWQHCARVAFVGATFSFEAYYQAIRRVWRFGQSRPVHVHVVMATTEKSVWAILEHKRGDFEVMKHAMVTAARRSRRTVAKAGTYEPGHVMVPPKWERS